MKTIHLNFWYILPVILLLCLVNYIIGLLAFKKRKYVIREHDVIYSKGLIIHSMITVPISRI